MILGRLRRVSRRSGQPGSIARVALVAFAVVLMTVGVAATAELYKSDIAGTFLAYTVLCGTVLLAPRAPVLSVLLHLAALLGLALLTADSRGLPWPAPVPAVVALAGLLAVLGIWSRWTVALVAWWGGVLVLLASVAVSQHRTAGEGDWPIDVAIAAAATGAVVAGAMAVGMRSRIADELRAARRDAQLEQEQRERAEERGLIARELHDVVAHSMSLVHMQATSAPYRLPSIDAETRREFENIARSARSALDEMRQMLGVLRPERAPTAALAPQPTLADLPALIAVTERAGSAVEARIAPGTEAMSAVQQLAAYRIVQEALGNVMRHAPGASARVWIDGEPDAWVVEVQNDPPPRERLPEHGAPLPDRGGRGLVGMRERVALLGGTMQHGAGVGGGYVVTATVPRAPDGRADEGVS